ncbi:MAG: 2'-5' RNA ligase family protein [Lachnospiraceae bacterium]|nr:2'-5' RNA ligase family protein [Lachnospiraceae bacterium]
MYLISAYFDQKAEKAMERYIFQIAAKTGNLFMTDNHVPPHLTISSVEARIGDVLLHHVENLRGQLSQGAVRFVSVGVLLPYVMYVTPVLNAYLQELSQKVYDAVSGIPEVSVSKFYQPMQWLPHLTLGKTLTKEQMRVAFEVMQERFVPFDATVIKIGLAKTNPHEDLWMLEL